MHGGSQVTIPAVACRYWEDHENLQSVYPVAQQNSTATSTFSVNDGMEFLKDKKRSLVVIKNVSSHLRDHFQSLLKHFLEDNINLSKNLSCSGITRFSHKSIHKP
jgi:hypothetical protein